MKFKHLTSKVTLCNSVDSISDRYRLHISLAWAFKIGAFKRK